MPYTEVSTVYNGCAEATYEFQETASELLRMNQFIRDTQRFAYDNSDATVEIYKLFHPHPQGIECECIQYETDHKPFWSSKQ